MDKKLAVVEFIENNPAWEKLLAAPPYCIKIVRDGGYIMLSYSQVESDFLNDIVRECRGLVLEDGTFRPVCVPFFKFGNYGESYVPAIDWASARTQEKIDGSLIKLWFDREKWHVSTNGTIDAGKAILTRTDLFGDCTYETFYDLFEDARRRAGLDLSALDKNRTYMFELVSPYNKVVILYPELDIYHIGTRDNNTLEELDVDIGVKKPKEFPLGDLAGCIAAATALPADKEGYVVVDKFYNRVKIKNPAYVALHRFKNNNEPNLSALVKLVREGETAEFLVYFPECTAAITDCEKAVADIIAELERATEELSRRTFETRKDFALAVKDMPFSAFFFDWYGNRSLSPKTWLWRRTDEQIKQYIVKLRIKN